MNTLTGLRQAQPVSSVTIKKIFGAIMEIIIWIIIWALTAFVGKH
jgi:hypothetical protein